jgi:hypothetical protein
MRSIASTEYRKITSTPSPEAAQNRALSNMKDNLSGQRMCSESYDTWFTISMTETKVENVNITVWLGHLGSQVVACLSRRDSIA